MKLLKKIARALLSAETVTPRQVLKPYIKLKRKGKKK